MKSLLLLAAGLACATLSHAQTTPAPPATGTTAPVSGTKNVGADRADAPKAPGMSTGTPGSQRPQRPVPASSRRAINRHGSATPAKAPAAPASVQ